MLRKTWMVDGFKADPAGLASNPDKLMPGSPEPDINLTTKPNDRACARGTWTEGVQQHPKLRRVMGTAHESLLYSAPN